MAITQLTAENFKGISKLTSIPLAPITVFLGANSSGKSTCIHALACMSQTIKIINNTAPLALDDQYADVHLGRFIDVIHTRDYKDVVRLGFTFDGPKMPLKRDGKTVLVPMKTAVEFAFKGTKRTQDLHLQAGKYVIGGAEFILTRHIKGNYTIAVPAQSISLSCTPERAFKINFLQAVSTKETAELFTKFMPLYLAQEEMIMELGRVRYLGPFRQPPLRQYPTRGSTPKEVGSMGESAIALLANESVQSQTRKHTAQVTKWLQALGLAKALSLTRSGTTDMFRVKLKLKDDTEFPIADLGYGLSQVLPVLVQCTFSEPESTLLFEQPEIHLHSIAARGLATVFIETALEKKNRILIETHSPELVKQFLCEIRDGKFPLADFHCYRISREAGHTQITPLEIDPNDCDVYENWERGISIP